MTKKTEREAEKIAITAPDIRLAEFVIVGTTPYVQHKFSEKAQKEIEERQRAGSTAAGKKRRTARDFEADYHAAQHVAREGWRGIPASAFRDSMIGACRLVQFQMTRAKCSIFIEADGYDATDGTPLVRITDGDPEPSLKHVRNESGVVDLRNRPLWREGWQATVTIRYDADQFTSNDIANLLMRAGMQLGIGEGRAFSKKSNGIGWGFFELKQDTAPTQS